VWVLAHFVKQLTSN